MAVTAKFVADFTDFNKGVQGAEKQLDSFIQQVDKAGGRLMDVKGYRDSTAAAGTLSNELRKFDSLLRTGGVSLGPWIGALAELGAVASIAAPRVAALLGPVGLIIGTFLTAKGATEAILGFFGVLKPLTEWAGTLIGHLSGFTKGAAEAGAKADVLALASKNAGHEVFDFNTAMKINRDAADKMAAGQEKLAPAVRATADAVHAAVEATVAAANRATDAAKDRAKAERDMWNDIGVGRMEYEAAQQAATDREAAQLRSFYNEMGVLAQNAWSPEPIVDWIEKVEEIPPAVAPAINAWKALGLASKEAAGYFEELKGKIDNAVAVANRMAADANKPKVGGSVAGMAPTWNQNQVARYGAGGYLGTGSPINININGSVLGNKDEIARVVGDAVTSSYRTGGNRLPV